MDAPLHAQQILDGLASPDPAVRDGQAMTALEKGLEDGSLAEEVDHIRAVCIRRLGEDHIHIRSFAALALARLVRAGWGEADVVEPLLAWYHEEGDTRGFDAELGWLHAVAHGADCIAELVRAGLLSPDRGMCALARRAVQPGPVWIQQEYARVARAMLRADLDAGSACDGATRWCDLVMGELDAFEERAGAEGLPTGPPPWLTNLSATLMALVVAVDEGEVPVEARRRQETVLRDPAVAILRRIMPWFLTRASDREHGPDS